MADDVEALVRRFEPILVFCRDERFFPCDAKRYIENCSLFSDGIAGDPPVPPRQVIGPLKIAASDALGEIRPGDTYLRNVIPVPSTEEKHFLSLGGWKQSAETGRRYADRDKVENLYLTSPLFESRFWYHAEFFDTNRLKRLTVPQESTDDQGDLDLSKVLSLLASADPALVCYYFFFPAHDESLPELCSVTETGKEYACFAGEWACMTVLVERGSKSKAYRPTFMGLSRHFNVGAGQGRDQEQRFGMSVLKWNDARSLDDHPALYASLGAHSLYLEPGDHGIMPYAPEATPTRCGEWESPGAFQEYQDSLPAEEKGISAAWFKIIGGSLLGGFAGFLVGGLLALLEANPPQFTGSTVQLDPIEDPPVQDMNDVGPLVQGFFGQVVYPQSFSSPPGEFLHAKHATYVQWAAQENLEIAGRHYGFIVDATQIWWPSDDGASGYRGRWGPLVEDDPFHRRSGMLFPEFWRMFFVALAKQV